MTDHEPTDTTLADIMHADQADAAVDALAGQVARFYRTLADAGMRKGDASALTASYAALAIGEHFGGDMSQLAVFPLYEGEG